MKKISALLAVCLWLATAGALAKPASFKLTIQPDPKDAKITLWNIKQTFKQGMILTEGRYHIQVSKDGYEPYLEWVTLKGKDLTLKVKLKAKPTRLFVETEPADAKINLMNIGPPYTPGISLVPGRYDLQVSAPGYKTYREWIEVGPGENRHKAALQAQDNAPGVRATSSPTGASGQAGLFVYPDPPDAKVMIMNITPPFTQGIRLAPGKYHIQVARAGHATRSQWVELGQEDVTLKVRLSPAMRCFSAHEAGGGSRSVQLRFRDAYVEAEYSLITAAGKAGDRFRLIGARQGNSLDLIGTAYYGTQPIELRSHMELKGDKLVVDFDGENRVLNKAACQE